MSKVTNKSSPHKRLGKRSAEESQATRDALLKAAAEAFAERGLNGAKLENIADRAGVTKGAIYSHFKGREDLLVQACRSALRELKIFDIAKQAPDIESFISQTAKAILAPESKAFRMLNIEVHLSAPRSEVMRELLAEWHAEGFKTLQDRLSPKLGTPETVFAMINFLFLGLSHIDALESINPNRKQLLAITQEFSSGFVITK